MINKPCFLYFLGKYQIDFNSKIRILSSDTGQLTSYYDFIS